MRITQWGEYGIHFSAYIAHRTVNGHPVVGAAEIAATQAVDIQYAQQILQRLRKGGIIESVRGPSGGYRLRKQAVETSVLDILIATEGDTLEMTSGDERPNDTASGRPNAANGLAAVWMGFKQHIDSYLKNCMLQDLITVPRFVSSDSEPALPRTRVQEHAAQLAA